jgi:L-arabinokinase
MVRSCDIIGHLLSIFPDIHVVVVSGGPHEVFHNRLGAMGGWSLRRAAFDVGLIQRDSMRVDLGASLAALADLRSTHAIRIEKEKRFLDKTGVGLVVADIPAIPLEAASALGVPRIAVGNFSWDWIYDALAAHDDRWCAYADLFRVGYRYADGLCKLPFSPPMEVFARQWPVPVLARPGCPRRDVLAKLTGADAGKKWVLMSFTALDWDVCALERIQQRSDYQLFAVKPMTWSGRNLFMVDLNQMSFPDIVASVDMVVTKPGYGIVSDCVVNAKPMLYADRNDFAEYDVLVAAIRRYLKHLHIPAAALYAGQVGAYLDRLQSQPSAWQSIHTGGAELVARRLVSWMVDRVWPETGDPAGIPVSPKGRNKGILNRHNPLR